jgi:hypothetical protein
MADLRILDGQVLDQGMYAQDWTPEALAEVAKAGGFQDLWNSGYSTQTTFQGEGSLGDVQNTYSPELLSKLGEYNFYRTGQRPGETDRGRHLVATDQSGNPVYNSTYGYSKWSDAPIEAARTLGSAYLGASALNGGLLGMGGATGAASGAGAAAGGAGGGAAGGAAEGFALGDIFTAGSAGAEGISGMGGGLSGGGAMTAGGSGGLLGGTLGKFAPGVAKFITDNPLLAKGLFSAATGLLSASGGSGGGGGEPKFGPAKQWKSPLQQGLIGNPQLTDIAKPVSFKGRW